MLYDARGREIPEPVRPRKRYGFIPSDPSPASIDAAPEFDMDPADAIASEHAETDTHEAIESCLFQI